MPGPTYPSFRPDASGVRGGVERKPRPAGDEFPYDRPTGQLGKNLAKAPGQSTGGSSPLPLTPRDTEYTVWDELAESIGLPVSLTISTRSGRANNYVPGIVRPDGARPDMGPSDAAVDSAGRGDSWSELEKYIEELLVRRGDEDDFVDRGWSDLPAEKSWRGLSPPEDR